MWSNSLKDRVDCRAVNVLQLLALIICLLVLNQSALTLPRHQVRKWTKAGLSQICNEFSIGAGFSYQAQCKYHRPGKPRAGVCWCLNARYSAAVVGLMREIITITIRWQLRLLRKAYVLFLIVAVWRNILMASIMGKNVKPGLEVNKS